MIGDVLARLGLAVSMLVILAAIIVRGWWESQKW